MPSARHPAPDLDLVFDPSADLPARIARLKEVRAHSGPASERSDLSILKRLDRSRCVIDDLRGRVNELGAMVEQLTATPWHTALFIRTVAQDDWSRALVVEERAQRLVEIDPSVDRDRLVPGASVFLSAERNALLGVAGLSLHDGGETAFFERALDGRRIVVKQRDEELVLDAAEALDVSCLQAGDELRFDRGALMAFEHIELGEATRYLIDSPVKVGAEALGGQDTALRQLLDMLSAAALDPDLANRYGLSGRCSVLLTGPPGCGKTLMTRIAAHVLDGLSSRGCKFFALKPGELESPFVGQTQANIRNAFKSIRQEAGDAIVVLFIDEVEAIGRHRGSGYAPHADLFTAAWLAELDGFQDRGNVAIVTATNRTDLIDGALYQRLSDAQIRVGRPDRAGARSIFRIHLGDDTPVRPNGAAGTGTRSELVDTAISELYAPNARGPLATLHFRDGSRREVGAPELVSGRVIEQVCRAARSRAFSRHVRGGQPGVDVGDMRFAVADALDRLGGTLTRENVRHYIADLPEDCDVVRVERPERQVKDEGPYLSPE